MLNELAQWAVLVFIGVFVFGLTRQLGVFIIPRQQQLEDLGPPLRKPIPTSLIPKEDRQRLRDMITASPPRLGALMMLDESCQSCTLELEHLREVGTPDAMPVAISTSSTGTEYQSLLGDVTPLVVFDRGARSAQQAGIMVTPFVMILDAELKVVHKQIGSLHEAVRRFREEEGSPIEEPLSDEQLLQPQMADSADQTA